MVRPARCRREVRQIEAKLLSKMPHLPQVAAYLYATAITVAFLWVARFFVPSVGFLAWAVGGVPVLVYSGKDAHRKWQSRRDDLKKITMIPSLEGKDLSHWNLTGIKLFERDDLATVTCQETNLRHAVLIRAIMPRASMRGADLSYANLTRANCEDAKFLGARLLGATLDGIEAAGARFDAVDLRYATLVGAQLTGASFEHADVRGADFTGATLDPDALATATSDSETVVPRGCTVRPADVSPIGSAVASVKSGIRTVFWASIRPTMVASFSVLLVGAAVVVGQKTTDMNATEVAAGDRTSAAETERTPAGSSPDSSMAEVESMPTTQAEDTPATQVEPTSTTRAEDTPATQVEPTSTTQAQSAPASESESPSPSPDLRAAPTDATDERIESDPTEVDEDSSGEVEAEPTAPLEESTTEQQGNGSQLIAPGDGSEAGGMQLVMRSDGGPSAAIFTSEVGNGDLEVVEEQSRDFEVAPTTGTVRVEVAPQDPGTSAYCEITVEGVKRDWQDGVPGQTVVCELALGRRTDPAEPRP